MINKNHIFGAIGAMAAVLVMTGCEHETYETGDGNLSRVTTAFGMLHTCEPQQADYLVTDNGEQIKFDTNAFVSWATTTDSLYRTLAYYKTAADGTAEPVTMNQVIVAPLYESVQLKDIPTDPLTFTSAWAAGGYLNVGFSVKAGHQDDDTQAQRIGFTRDSIRIVGGKRVSYIRMMHAQNGQPEYYSVRSFVSLPWPQNSDSISLRVNDYDQVIVIGVAQK